MSYESKVVVNKKLSIPVKNILKLLAEESNVVLDIFDNKVTVICKGNDTNEVLSGVLKFSNLIENEIFYTRSDLLNIQSLTYRSVIKEVKTLKEELIEFSELYNNSKATLSLIESLKSYVSSYLD